MINSAWLSDDSFITLRHVLNFINGYGPTFNVDERVQGYTHPVWFLIISFFSLFCNYIYATYLISFACSICVIAFLIRETTKVSSSSILKPLVYILIICSSKAFIDFSTSGLENPLSHVLIIIFFIQYFSYISNKDKKLIYSMALSTALLYLNRMDLILIVAPAIVHILKLLVKIRAYKLCVVFTSIIGCPVLAWHLFSLIYYGFLFPNTAYAKLATGIEWHSYLNQGLYYFYYTALNDPITILTIIMSIVTILNRKDNIVPVIGIVIYLLYVLKIGGDFMAGRFFSSVFVLSLYLIIRTDYKLTKTLTKTVFICFLGLLIFNSKENFTYDYKYENQYEGIENFSHGICNERAWYFNSLGFRQLINSNMYYEKLVEAYDNWIVESKPLEIRVTKSIGVYSIVKGPQLHVIDIFALVDPLLSKLPVIDINNYRIGHFERIIPYGYISSLLLDKNVIADSHLRAYYNRLYSVVRGDLFSSERLNNILFLNFNIIPKHFDDTVAVSADNFSNKIPEGSLWNSLSCINFNDVTSVELIYDHDFELNTVDISTDSNDYYDIFIDGQYLDTIEPKQGIKGISTSKIVSKDGPKRSSSILVKAHGGDNMNSICYVHIN